MPSPSENTYHMLQTSFYLESVEPFCQLLPPQSDPVELQPIHPRWQRRVLRAIDYIHQHYSNHISQESLSIEVQLSVPKLQSGLKMLTGHTLYSYHEQVKINAAKSLLESTDLPLKAIANKVGFKTHSHFGEVFKRIAGITPSAYRNQHGH
jgi:AraC-like DNA-binding protein